MPDRCIVYGCNHPGGHKFPAGKKLRAAWVHVVRREIGWTPTDNSRVCRKHFRPEDYTDGPTAKGSLVRKKKFLIKNVVPSIFEWSKPQSAVCKERKDRGQHRQKKKEECDERKNSSDLERPTDCVLAVGDVGITEVVVDGDNTEAFALDNGEGSTSGTRPDKNNVSHVTHPLASIGIQADLKPAFLSVESVEFDTELLHYFTGLETFDKFLAVFQSLGPGVNYLQYYRTAIVDKISTMNQFLLMLAKLRQAIDYILLARMCGVARSTAENIFVTWVNFCSRQWGEINVWVDGNLVRYYAPADFQREFPTTRVILDGTEVPVERPSNPVAQRATFSTYKNKNTVKTIVGATPGGLVSFISPTYGGSASDRQLIERSQLPKMCESGDSVMADKGFNVQDLFAASDVQVNIPAFFTQKNRLSGMQVLKDRKIASKRVHIERIIGLGKTYKILVNGLNATETKLSRHIMNVCYMLCNFKRNVVSRDA